MKFAVFNNLYFLWAVAGLAVFAVILWRRRKKALLSFASSEVLEHILSSVDERMKFWKIVLRISVPVLLVFALARPQWGFHWQQLQRRGVDVYIALDVSKSMLAEDIKPNRLERSKLAIKDLVSNLGGDRIGLIAFAGSAFIQCPLTVDHAGFLLTLEQTGVDTIPRGGTNISAALKAAIKGFEKADKKYSVLILITDGEEHEGQTQDLIEKLKESGIRVYTIGIGTQSGELIPVVDSNGNKEFLKDRAGNIVKTRMDDSILKDLALKTGGSYVHATPLDFGLGLIYEKKISKLEERSIEAKQAKQYEERFQLFLLPAFLLLVLEMCLSTKKKKV